MRSGRKAAWLSDRREKEADAGHCRANPWCTGGHSMKLVSFAASGRNSYGAVVGDGVFDLGRRLDDRYPTLRAAIAGDALGAAAAEVKSGVPDIALSQVTLLPPITDPDKIICAGRNYRAHAAEAGGAPPENPSVFLRLVNTLVAHNQPMVCPKISGDFD